MKRRLFLAHTLQTTLATAAGLAVFPPIAAPLEPKMTLPDSAATTLFLCGDVMTGRAIDQVLPHPSPPQIYEPYLRSARDYVTLTEQATGPIKQPVTFDYIWGDALTELQRMRPDVRIVNLETAVTTSEDAWPGKGIHYRMNPRNIPCLTVAALDCCVLANNHVLDWGRSGFIETLRTLRNADILTAGAGQNADEAAMPAVISVGANRRVLAFAYGSPSSGIPEDWAATGKHSGINLLHDLSARSIDAIAANVRAHKRSGDIVVLSLHWGGNWGYHIAAQERDFARALIDHAAVDVLHGHSSHHPKGMEIYHHKLILYGCGDFINDYEGIGGYEQYRPDLSLMYFPTLNAVTGELVRLVLTPMRMRHFRVNRAEREEATWLAHRLDRESGKFNARLELQDDNTLTVRWS